MGKEKLLALPGGRTLAYAEAGNVASTTLVIFFHGAFSVGNAKRPSAVLLEKGVHFVAPTLPGWGNSSPTRHGEAYATSLATDITTLIDHLSSKRRGFEALRRWRLVRDRTCPDALWSFLRGLSARTKYRRSAARQRMSTFPLLQELRQVFVVVKLHHDRPTGAAYPIQSSAPPYEAHFGIQNELP
jgi:hypothetical protein